MCVCVCVCVCVWGGGKGLDGWIGAEIVVLQINKFLLALIDVDTSLPLALSYPGGLWYSTIYRKELKLDLGKHSVNAV